MDVIIVKPGNQKQLYGELDAYSLTAYEPPLWAALLAAYLRLHGIAVALLDVEVEQLTFAETTQRINDIAPKLAVLSVSGTNPSASTMNMSGAEEIIRHLRQLNPRIKTLLHGLHPSALPQQSLVEGSADYVCQGEGFFTLRQLVEALNTGGTTRDIAGLWQRDGTTVIHPATAELVADLDRLPSPAWDLLPMGRYRAHNWHCFDNIVARQPYGVVFTSLGCPYHCAFCCINAIFGKSGIRFRSAQRVVEDIDLLVQNYGIRNIKIIDELFAVNEKRVVEICDLLIERGYDLNMWAYARLNTVTPLMLQKMKQAGINWIAYGFESGSERVLKGVDKAYDPGIVEQVIAATYAAGLYISANFIFGLPDDDFDSMQDTLDLAIKINAEWANFYVTMAYPGSQLYKQALGNGTPLPRNWVGYSQYSPECLPLPTNNLTPGEILSFRDYAFNAYFENPRYLDKMQRTYGLETVRHIQSMTAHRLERIHTQFDAPKEWDKNIDNDLSPAKKAKKI